ncbi:MAG: hypothetical protein WC058_02250 [Phycisphaeraceae bacterium]
MNGSSKVGDEGGDAFFGDIAGQGDGGAAVVEQDDAEGVMMRVVGRGDPCVAGLSRLFEQMAVCKPEFGISEYPEKKSPKPACDLGVRRLLCFQ